MDQGYKGHGITEQKVTIVGRNQKTAAPALKRMMKRRAAIEPLIGHAKNDSGDPRNHLLGKSGDQIHALMMAIGFNFRKIVRRVTSALNFWILRMLTVLMSPPQAVLKVQNLNP